jgi:hypothetical protein
VQCASKIVYDPMDLTREINCYNIDFIPRGDTDQELRDSQIFFIRRNRLKNLLKVEQQLDIITQAISRGQEGKEAALMLISQATPCIMHLENRLGEKLITVLLARAAEKFQQRGNTRNLTRFAAQIQHIVNTRVLGSMTRPKQWKVPLSQ